MKPATLMRLICLAGVLTGCTTVKNLVTSKPGSSVEFVAANTTSVLADYDVNRPDDLQYATAMAKEKCGLFGRSTAALESLNPRGDGKMRATYICQ